jgi:hypothetical protein
MPFPIYQYVINLVVSLPIRGGPGVFMNASVGEHRALNCQIFNNEDQRPRQQHVTVFSLLIKRATGILGNNTGRFNAQLTDISEEKLANVLSLAVCSAL